jgi:hypothetical protein
MSRNIDTNEWIWIYNFPGADFPCAIFDSLSKASEWIMDNKVSGTLTKMPVNISVYDWAKQAGYFKPKTPHHFSPKYIGQFSSAYLEHYHFEFDDEGNLVSGGV